MASEVAKRLRDRRLNVWNDAKKIAEDAAQENRVADREEQGKWDANQEEMSKLDTRIKAVLDTEKRAKDADDAYDALSGRKPEQGQAARTAGGGEMLERDPQVGTRRGGRTRSMEIRHQADRGPINYRVLCTPPRPEHECQLRHPDGLLRHADRAPYRGRGIMQCGPTVLNTGGGETLQVPKTTAHSSPAPPSPHCGGQAATLPTSDPAFSMVTLSAYKYGVLLQVARELIDDTAVDLLGYLAMQAGRALGNNFGNDLVNGTGTRRPERPDQPGHPRRHRRHHRRFRRAFLCQSRGHGVLASSPPTASRAAATGWRPTRPSGASARSPIPSAARSGSRRAVLGSPDLLLGKPLVADPFMPAMATSAKAICFGDFSQFFVRLVGGVRFERSDDFAFGSDLVTFRAILRGDGTLVDQTGAIEYYIGAST